jgi:hypothetical protein
VTLEVRLRPEAEQDLADAAAWYEAQRQGLGHEFLDEVLTMLSSIAETHWCTRTFIGTQGALSFIGFRSAFIFGRRPRQSSSLR